jgi:hypothetical protein
MDSVMWGARHLQQLDEAVATTLNHSYSPRKMPTNTPDNRPIRILVKELIGAHPDETIQNPKQRFWRME